MDLLRQNRLDEIGEAIFVALIDTDDRSTLPSESAYQEETMKKSKLRATTVILGILVLMLVATIYPVAASAGDIEFDIAITDKDGNAFDPDVEIKKNAKINLDYSFMIDNAGDVKAGDTITLAIPKEIKINASIPPYDVTDGEGGPVVCTVALNKDTNEITVVFTEYASENSNVGGSFFFKLEFDETQLGTGGEKELAFEVGGAAADIVLKVKIEPITPPDMGIDKSVVTYDTATREITWKVEVDPKGYGRDGVVVTDKILSGQEFVAGSVTVNGEEADSENYEYVASNFIYTFPDTVNDKQTIRFKTKVTDAAFAGVAEGNSFTVTNRADLDYEGKPTEKEIYDTADKTITVNFIEKTGTPDNANKEIDWKIIVNSNRVAITNAQVVDVIPEGLTVDKGTLKVDGVFLEEGKDYSLTKNADDIWTLTVKFGNISTVKEITFTTKVAESYYYQNTSTSFSNTAELKHDTTGLPGNGTVPPGAATGTGTADAGTSLIAKSGAAYDPQTAVITWSITVNANAVSLIDPEVTDDIPSGQEFVDGSFKVGGATIIENAEGSGLTYTAAASGDTEKTGTLTYKISGTVTAAYAITFQTRVTEPAVYLGNTTDAIYKNTAKLQYKKPGSEQLYFAEDDGEQKVNNNVITKTGEGYDYRTQEIT